MAGANLETDYQLMYQKLLDNLETGDLNKSLEIAGEIRNRFPEHFIRASFNLAHIQSLMNLEDDVITTLEEAYDAGGWWLEDEFVEFPIIDSLKENPRFQSILKKYQKRYEEELKKCKPQWLVRTPPDYDTTKTYPIIFALHWRGSNMARFEPYWKQSTLNHGVILCVPQSSQLIEPDGYTWHDTKLGLDELEQCYLEVSANYMVDSRNVILAGASIGGKLALDATFIQPRFPVRGVIAVIPHCLNVSELLTNIDDAMDRSIRCCLVSGTEDSSYEPCKELAQRMNENGLEYLFLESSGSGHIIPPDFDKMLSEMIPFLLG